VGRGLGAPYIFRDRIKLKKSTKLGNLTIPTRKSDGKRSRVEGTTRKRLFSGVFAEKKGGRIKGVPGVGEGKEKSASNPDSSNCKKKGEGFGFQFLSQSKRFGGCRTCATGFPKRGTKSWGKNPWGLKDGGKKTRNQNKSRHCGA